VHQIHRLVFQFIPEVRCEYRIRNLLFIWIQAWLEYRIEPKLRQGVKTSPKTGHFCPEKKNQLPTKKMDILGFHQSRDQK